MTEGEQLAESAEWFRRRHRGPGPVVLPNAWDAASAQVMQEAGFEAIATTSAGVAASLGREDHEGLGPDDMFAAVGRIAAAVSVPVTADLESGYGLDATELVERALGAGVVGMNLEDTDHRAGGLRDPEIHASRLAEVKEAARAAGVDLVLNARVDVFLGGDRPEEEGLEEALRRARLYREAGADCLFPIMLSDEAVMRAFVEESGGPVNILARPDGRHVDRLAEIGVSRVSFGSGLMRETLAGLGRLLGQLRMRAR